MEVFVKRSWAGSLIPAFLLILACAPGLRAQTDAAFSVMGSFGHFSSGNGTYQTQASALGGLVQLRHVANPLVGYELTYSYNRANQEYSSSGSSLLILPPVSVSANAHQVTADWVVSLHVLNLKPFALAGVGVLLTVPVGGQIFTTRATDAVYVYGVGVDATVLPHLGLRLQYRGNVNRAPGIAQAYSSTHAFMHTAEPMVGAYFRF
jgi:opacity protein-like surface antigen